MTGTKEDYNIQFFLHYIKSGLLPKETGKLYGHLFDWRQETDYADFIEFNEKLVKPMLESVKELNETLKKLLK